MRCYLCQFQEFRETDVDKRLLLARITDTKRTGVVVDQTKCIQFRTNSLILNRFAAGGFHFLYLLQIRQPGDPRRRNRFIVRIKIAVCSSNSKVECIRRQFRSPVGIDQYETYLNGNSVSVVPPIGIVYSSSP